MSFSACRWSHVAYVTALTGPPRRRRSPRRSGARAAPTTRAAAAPAPRGSAPRAARRTARRAPRARGRGRSGRPTHGPRGWLSPWTMPASMSAALPTPSPKAKAASLIDLADDPAEHEARGVADPGGVLAERGEEALGRVRGRRRRCRDRGSSSTSDECIQRRQRVEADRGAAGVERGERAGRAADRLRAALERRLGLVVGPSDRGSGTAPRPSVGLGGRGHLPAGVCAAARELVRERRSRRRSRSAPSPPPAAGGSGSGGRCSPGPSRVVVVAAPGLAAQPSGGHHAHA